MIIISCAASKPQTILADTPKRTKTSSRVYTTTKERLSSSRESVYSSKERQYSSTTDRQKYTVNPSQSSSKSGIVFSEDDPLIPNEANETARIPAGFWKIIAFKKNDRLTSAGFLVWQRDYDKAAPESFEPVLEQVRITTIEFLTGLSFFGLRSIDTLLFNNSHVPTVSHAIPPDGSQASLIPNQRASYISSISDIILK